MAAEQAARRSDGRLRTTGVVGADENVKLHLSSAHQHTHAHARAYTCTCKVEEGFRKTFCFRKES